MNQVDALTVSVLVDNTTDMLSSRPTHVASELQAFDFDVIVPGHCTGWRAMNAFVAAFGEGVVDPRAVGSPISL